MKIFLIVTMTILAFFIVRFDNKKKKESKTQTEISLLPQGKKYEYELTLLLTNEKVITQKGYSNMEYDSINGFLEHSEWIKETKDGLEIQSSNECCFVPNSAIQKISIERNEITKR